MSVIMRMVVPADTDQFRSWIASDTEFVTRLAERAKELGCKHHRFAIGDGELLVLDEWESAEAFQGFFEDNEEIASAMQSAGAQGPPDVAFYEAIETSDQF